jgi:hypothetical protein
LFAPQLREGIVDTLIALGKLNTYDAPVVRMMHVCSIHVMAAAAAAAAQEEAA